MHVRYGDDPFCSRGLSPRLVRMISLEGQTILLTGALGAISQSIVQALAAAGARLILTDLRPEDEANEVLARWGIDRTRVHYQTLDVTDTVALESTIAALLARFPGCRTVIGHAGGCGLHPFLKSDAAGFEAIWRFNFIAQTSLARAVARVWSQTTDTRPQGGQIIFTSSYVARFPHRGISAYASAKAALECFARCLALELAGYDIRCNLVSPGNVAVGSSLLVYDADPAYRAFVDRATPSGIRNTPQAIANAFLFLCSSLAEEINGQTLSVDHGISIPKID